MNKLFVTGLVFGFACCILMGNVTQGKNSMPALSDTSGTQKYKLKKQEPQQKLKEHKSVKEKTDPGKLDTLKQGLLIPQRPLLRLKDSSRTIPQ